MTTREEQREIKWNKEQISQLMELKWHQLKRFRLSHEAKNSALLCLIGMLLFHLHLFCSNMRIYLGHLWGIIVYIPCFQCHNSNNIYHMSDMCRNQSRKLTCVRYTIYRYRFAFTGFWFLLIYTKSKKIMVKNSCMVLLFIIIAWLGG